MDSKTIGPAAGADTVYRLARGDRHRGATWWDEEIRVVWLCGYGYHESGADDDAFPYFRGLMDRGRLRPDNADLEAVFDDRAERLARALPAAAQRLLDEARANPMAEVRGPLGAAQVGVVVEVVQTLEATFVAITGARSRREVYAILVAFFPEAEFGEWTPESKLPDRDLDIAVYESCWSILHGNAE